MKKTFTLSFLIFICSIASAQVWNPIANYAGSARSLSSAFSIPSLNKGYVVGGSNLSGSIYHNDVWAYDVTTNSWTQVLNFPGLPDAQVAFTINELGYVGTGVSGGYQFSKSFYVYDPVANTWTAKATFPGAARGYAVGFAVNGKGYIGGGSHGNNFGSSYDFYEYDPTSDTWTRKSNCPALGCDHMAVGFAIGNKGYIGTGSSLDSVQNTETVQQDFWEYDPSTDTWTRKADFGGGTRSGAVGFVTCGRGFIGCGYTNSTQSVREYDFWEYNPQNNTWLQVANMGATSMAFPSAFTIGDTSYAGNGSTSNSYLNSWYEYSSISSTTGGFAANSTSICANQSVLFTDTSGFAPTSWQWTFTGGTPATSTSQNPTVTYSTPGQYDVTLIATSNCYSNTISKTQYITVGVPGSLSILPKSPAICSGGMVTLTATGGSGLVWSPSASLNQSSGASVVASPTITTIYNVNGAGGCTSSGFDTVIVNQPVPVSISPAATTVCAGSGVLLTATTAGTNITWSPSAGLSATAGASVTATPSSTATYTASAVGCVSPGSNVVTVTQPQQLTVYPSSSTICAGQSVPLVATASGTNIVWSPAAGLSTTNGASPTASPTISTTYTVSSTGCTSPGTVVFTVTQPVPLTVTPASPKICLGGSGTTLSATGGTGITWSPPTGLNTTNGGSVTATPLTTTVYTATASGGCTSPTTDTVIVNQPSLLTIAPASPSICAGQTVTLTVTGGTGISWNPSTGLNTATGSPVVANAPVNDSMTYIVTGTNAAGCSAAGLVTLHTGGSSIPGDVTTIRDTLCQGTPGNLALIGNSTNTIQWQSSSDDVNFTDINVTDTTRFKTEPLIKTTWYRATVGSGACIAESDTLQLFVPPALTAFFSATQTKAKQLTFDADSSSGNIQAYHWDFGDGQTSSEKDPVHTFKSDTTYYVCLTLYDGSNCSYTFCRYLDILAEGVPTVLAAGDWVIYPNPFSEQLTVSSEQGTGASKIQSIEMYDVLGRMVLNNVLDNSTNTSLRLDVSSLAKGMYFVIIKTADANYVQKVVKQ